MHVVIFLSSLLAVGSAPRQESEAGSDMTPSQIHIGHVMTSMNGTPDRVGLIDALTTEAEIAAQHATLAASDLTDLDAMKRHTKHVRHALDPSTEEGGPGKGFGVIRAADGVSTHVKLAARSDGAADRTKTHAVHIATSADNVSMWSKAALAEAEKVLAAETAEAASESMTKIATLMEQLQSGTDANEDGKVSWESGEGGIAQARQHLEIMTQ